jgi:hypothetical protein
MERAFGVNVGLRFLAEAGEPRTVVQAGERESSGRARRFSSSPTVDEQANHLGVR